MFVLRGEKNKTAASVEGRGRLTPIGGGIPLYLRALIITYLPANYNIKGWGIFRMSEITKMQEIIVDMVRKITSQAKLQRILRLVQHLYIR